ncbi:DUF5677 domain-containing protein [Beijerinckia sp. L45]|uniref:DUF5677 domain-containing protein n=1 Tax=Beijerinckia sp. L45 TaxID=1641855 RepID=UPI00131B81C8|nr:DUF5677 domain-containing protein [Beijerinckia sp. L45]
MTKRSSPLYSDPINEFLNSVDSLDNAIQASIVFSETHLGIHVDGMTLRAYHMHARACVIAISLLKICHYTEDQLHSQNFTLDHAAISALSRTIVETCLLVSYCAEPNIAQEETELRFLLFRVHDTHARYMLFKEMRAMPFGQQASIGQQCHDFRRGLDELRTQLDQNNIFINLSPERQKRIKAGQDMYVRGIRDVARRFGKLDTFNYFYVYMSAFSHCSPLSFMRVTLNNISNERPSGNQLNIATQALFVSADFLQSTNQMMQNTFDAIQGEPPP